MFAPTNAGCVLELASSASSVSLLLSSKVRTTHFLYEPYNSFFEWVVIRDMPLPLQAYLCSPSISVTLVIICLLCQCFAGWCMSCFGSVFFGADGVEKKIEISDEKTCDVWFCVAFWGFWLVLIRFLVSRFLFASAAQSTTYCNIDTLHTYYKYVRMSEPIHPWLKGL